MRFNPRNNTVTMTKAEFIEMRDLARIGRQALKKRSDARDFMHSMCKQKECCKTHFDSESGMCLVCGTEACCNSEIRNDDGMCLSCGSK